MLLIEVSILIVIQNTLRTGNNKSASNLFTFIEISRRQRDSSPRAFFRLLRLRYKRQDRSGNGNPQRIQSVLCEEEVLRVKRIIVV